jgi:AraC-like DNA-binding protein
VEHAIRTFSLDTNDYPEPDRFDLWRDTMAATHEVTLPAGSAPSFAAHVSLWHLDHLLLSHGSFSRQIFTRTPAMIRHDQLDHVGLFIQASGQRICRTDKGEVTLEAGDALLADLAQPMVSLTSDGSSGTLYLPRELVEAELPCIDRLHGTVLRDPAAQLLARHIYALGDVLPQTTPEAMLHLAHATEEMALACLVAHTSGQTAVPEPVVPLVRRRIERYIDAHLGEPDLDVGTICAAFSTSRSNLYRLFESHGGVAGYIKGRRLHRIRAILLEGTDLRPMADIAGDYGFRTGAHFSREFRAAFGHAPGEMRFCQPHDPTDQPWRQEPVGIARLFHSLQV